jgi:hypothetical protein
MTPVFVDDAAMARPNAPKLEGGLVLHLCTISHNVLRAKAQRKGLGRARSDDPPQRIEHLSGGASPPSGAHYPRGATPRTPSDLHALSGDLTSPLEHRVFSSPVAWPSHTHTHVRVATRVHLGPFFTRLRASPLTANSLASPLNFFPLLCP